MNADLIAKLEAKDKELAAAWRASARSKAEPGTTQAKAEVVTATDADPAPPRSYTGEQVGNSTVSISYQFLPKINQEINILI